MDGAWGLKLILGGAQRGGKASARQTADAIVLGDLKSPGGGQHRELWGPGKGHS